MQSETLLELAKIGAKIEYDRLQVRMNFLRAEFPSVFAQDTKKRLAKADLPKTNGHRRRFTMSPEQRAFAADRMRVRMKKYWANKRKAKATAA